MTLVLAQLRALFPEPAEVYMPLAGIVIIGVIVGMAVILWKTSKPGRPGGEQKIRSDGGIYGRAKWCGFPEVWWGFEAKGGSEGGEEELIYVLALRAIAGQLSPAEYRRAAVPGGVGAALGIWSRV